MPLVPQRSMRPKRPATTEHTLSWLNSQRQKLGMLRDWQPLRQSQARKPTTPLIDRAHTCMGYSELVLRFSLSSVAVDCLACNANINQKYEISGMYRSPSKLMFTLLYVGIAKCPIASEFTRVWNRCLLSEVLRVCPGESPGQVRTCPLCIGARISLHKILSTEPSSAPSNRGMTTP